MLFSPNQIEELMQVIRFNHVLFGVESIGSDVLSDADKELLLKFGVDPAVYVGEGMTELEQAFHFGRLAAALGNYQTKSIQYDDFKKFVQRGGHRPLTQYEKNVLTSLKEQSFRAVKGIGEKVAGRMATVIADKEISARAAYEDILREELTSGIVNKKTVGEVVLDLGKATGDWERDLGRLVETEYHNAYEEGRAAQLQDKGGADIRVYKNVYPGACRHCIRLYLTNGIGSEPIIFKLSQLRANGTNVGRKASEWKAVVGSTHPYCFDDKTEVMTRDGWKLFNSLEKEDMIMSIDLSSGSGGFVGIKHMIGYHYAGDMHHFHNKKFDSLVTPDHRNVISTIKNRKGRLVRSDELPFGSRFLRSFPDWIGNEEESVTVCGVEYPADLFSEFLGYYMSEGSCSIHSGGYQVKISQEKHLEKMAVVCKRLFKKVWVGKDGVWIPLDDITGMWFRGLGKSFTKRIPDIMMGKCKRYIGIFLEAFALGDGSKRTRDHFGGHSSTEVCYYTSSPVMSAQLGELIMKLGATPSYSSFFDPDGKSGYKYNNPVEVIRHGHFGESLLSKMRHDIVKYDGMVYDVELEKWNTLVVRRNGRVTVSGNCRCEMEEVPDGYLWDSEKQSFSKLADDYKPKHVFKLTINIGGKDYTY